MDNINISTGNAKVDFVLLGVSWGGALWNPQTVPIVLSSAASLLVILNQLYIFKTRKKRK